LLAEEFDKLLDVLLEDEDWEALQVLFEKVKAALDSSENTNKNS